MPQNEFTINITGAANDSLTPSASASANQYTTGAEAPLIDISATDFYQSLENSVQQHILKSVSTGIYELYNPQINGGYVILVELGPWIELLDRDEHLKERYGNVTSTIIQKLKKFQSSSPMLAYTIDPGTISSSSDTYNLRHFGLPIFSYETKIETITVTYLETDDNLVSLTHDIWVQFMADLKRGDIDLSDLYGPATNYDIASSMTYPIFYYGAIWAYAFNPVDLTPKILMKFIGVYPSAMTLSETYGNRAANEHYMKAINYHVADFDRAVYVDDSPSIPSIQKFSNFANQSYLVNEFMIKYSQIMNVK